ncbi:ribokinase [Sporolactobacillus sp. THM7-7]|nr:ribokinase [Sporolactobacillus sp. THM7-7]
MVKIAVVGSCSIDLITEADRRPAAGETIIGKSLTVSPGGKGANQAVAASRLGGEVCMIGCVGDDLYGKQILKNLQANRVDVSCIKLCRGVSSGTAHITVAEGDNSIIVVPGANSLVKQEVIDESRSVLKSSDIVLLQHEIPMASVIDTIQLCRRVGVPVILNPAPVEKIGPDLLAQIDYVTPNEHEAAVLFPDADICQAAERYPNQLIVTMGERGTIYFDGEQIRRVSAYPVQAADTTGAGDTFNGAFAVAVSEGRSIRDSVRFANAAAGLSVTKVGAQGGMPYREAVERMLADEKANEA